MGGGTPVPIPRRVCESIGGGEGQILHEEGVHLSLFGNFLPAQSRRSPCHCPLPLQVSPTCFSPALLVPIPLGARLATPSAGPERPLPTAAPPARPRLRSPRASVQEGGVVVRSWGWGLIPSPPHPGGTGESHLGLRGDCLAHTLWGQDTDLTGASSRPWHSPAGPLEHFPGWWGAEP